MEEEEASLQMICPVITKRGVKGKRDDTLFGLVVCLYLMPDCMFLNFASTKLSFSVCVFPAQSICMLLILYSYKLRYFLEPNNFLCHFSYKGNLLQRKKPEVVKSVNTELIL